MANSLTKTIMNNISKKMVYESSDLNNTGNQENIKNISEKQEEILKSILHKNNSYKTSIKELVNKKDSTDTNSKRSKDKQNKKIISLKDLAK